jgi:hypothetical protein
MNNITQHPFEHAADEQLDQPADLSTFQPVAVAARADGWTPERQRQFIEELADCGVVREAAARVGMSEQGAYQLRRRPDAASFNQAWDAAVQLGVHRLHSTAFERAIAGTVRQRFYQGEVVGEETVFDNRLLIYLLGRLDKNRNFDVHRTMDDWHGTVGALEDGVSGPLPAPDERDGSPVWRDEDGDWCTSFPPPEGFGGQEWGAFGDEDYCRTLTDDEMAAVEARESRLVLRAAKQRDRYFARLNEDA